MLKATAAGELHRPPRDDEGEVPLASGRGFTKPLEYQGSEDEPDEFDIRDRIPLEFAEDSPQQAGKRAKKIEELLNEHNADLERVDDAQDNSRDGTSDAGDEAEEDE